MFSSSDYTLGVIQIIGKLLALLIVSLIVVVLVALMTGSKIIWTGLDQGTVGGSCQYMGFWPKEIDYKRKFVLFESCDYSNPQP